MPIEELQEPIWDRQKGETPNQYCFFQEFLKWPTYNLKDFHNYLCNHYSRLPKVTDKAKIPKYGTMKNWSSLNNWTSRKEAKRAAEKQDILDTLHELDKEDAIEEFLLKKSIKRKLLRRLEKEADYEKYSQLKHGADAFTILNDDNRVDKEEPTTFTNQKLDVDAETKVQYEGVENLLEVFHASKDEWDKRKSQ
jgi:hypothetical protein